MAMAFLIGRCRGPSIPRPRTLPGAADTTRRRSTPSVRMTIKADGAAGAASSKPRASLVPAPEVVQTGKSPIGLIAFGSTDFAVRESRDQLKKEYRLDTDYLRLRAFPFPPEVLAFIAAHERVYVVEQNRDAQMLSLLKLDMPAEQTPKLRSIRHFNGLPVDAYPITNELVRQEEI